MSDNEFMMSDEEEDPFEYEDSDDEMVASDSESQTQSLENEYYSGKALKEDDPEEAKSKLEAIVMADDPILSFKATKQLMKIANSQGADKTLIKLFDQLCDQKSNVESTYFASLVEKIIEKYAGVPGFVDAAFSKVTVLPKSSQIRLHVHRLRVMSNLGSISEIEAEARLLLELSTGDDYVAKQTRLEAYSTQLGILVRSGALSEREARSRARTLLEECSSLERSLIAHPGVVGVTSEARGLLQMEKRCFVAARDALMESFKSYDEAGLGKDKTRVLKCLLVVSMLDLLEDVSILQANEIQPYLVSDDLEVQELVHIVRLLHEDRLEPFLDLISLISDTFLSSFVDQLAQVARERALIKLCSVYLRVSESYVCSKTRTDPLLLQQLIYNMSRAGRLFWHITFDFEAHHMYIRERGSLQGLGQGKGINRAAGWPNLGPKPNLDEAYKLVEERLRKALVIPSTAPISGNEQVRLQQVGEGGQKDGRLVKLAVSNEKRAAQERRGRGDASELQGGIEGMAKVLDGLLSLGRSTTNGLVYIPEV